MTPNWPPPTPTKRPAHLPFWIAALVLLLLSTTLSLALRTPPTQVKVVAPATTIPTTRQWVVTHSADLTSFISRAAAATSSLGASSSVAEVQGACSVLASLVAEMYTHPWSRDSSAPQSWTEMLKALFRGSTYCIAGDADKATPEFTTASELMVTFTKEITG